MRSPLLLVLAAGVALAAEGDPDGPEPDAPAQTVAPAPTFEYAVRCLFRGSEGGMTANYKLKCQELGSEVRACASLEYERCRLEIVNEMGAEGWRFVDTLGDRALGPSSSLTFEREVWGMVPVQPAP